MKIIVQGKDPMFIWHLFYYTYMIIITELQQEFFKDFGGMLCKEFIIRLEPVSTIHYYRPGTFINCLLHYTWFQNQEAHPNLIKYTTPCKLACCLTQKLLQNHGSSISSPPKKIFEESSLQLWIMKCDIVEKVWFDL